MQIIMRASNVALPEPTCQSRDHRPEFGCGSGSLRILPAGSVGFHRSLLGCGHFVLQRCLALCLYRVDGSRHFTDELELDQTGDAGEHPIVNFEVLQGEHSRFPKLHL